ncbi:hypothetical protein KSP40_PGU005546 [Platanthera guangdongensis]|uniref:Uncharacterized protein n=1 Tax=Platanthera guangdongensis TaxID=2320717 RepID=A0ABR2N241_9ASPA
MGVSLFWCKACLAKAMGLVSVPGSDREREGEGWRRGREQRKGEFGRYDFRAEEDRWAAKHRAAKRRPASWRLVRAEATPAPGDRPHGGSPGLKLRLPAWWRPVEAVHALGGQAEVACVPVVRAAGEVAAADRGWGEHTFGISRLFDNPAPLRSGVNGPAKSCLARSG